MLYIFTGNGKGKTSAALGMAFRAAGYGKQTVVIQFLKGRECGERLEVQKEKKICILPCGKEGWTDFAHLSEEDYQMADGGFELANDAVAFEQVFLLVLDEFNLAVSHGLIILPDAVNFLKKARKKVHIVSTGRDAPQEFIDIADVVTEFKEVKHIYRKGVQAVRGLDY